MQMGCYSSSPFTCAFGQPVAKPIKRRQFKHQPLQCKNLPRCKFAKLPSVRFYMMTGGVIHIRWNDPFRIKSPMCHRKQLINPTGLPSSQEVKVHGLQFPSDLFKAHKQQQHSIRRSDEIYSKVTFPSSQQYVQVGLNQSAAVAVIHRCAPAVPCSLLLHTVSDAANDAIPTESVLKWHPSNVLTDEAS